MKEMNRCWQRISGFGACAPHTGTEHRPEFLPSAAGLAYKLQCSQECCSRARSVWPSTSNNPAWGCLGSQHFRLPSEKYTHGTYFSVKLPGCANQPQALAVTHPVRVGSNGSLLADVLDTAVLHTHTSRQQRFSPTSRAALSLSP